jgi:hypothetical protein
MSRPITVYQFGGALLMSFYLTGCALAGAWFISYLKDKSIAGPTWAWFALAIFFFAKELRTK